MRQTRLSHCPLSIKGVLALSLDTRVDERGTLSRIWERTEIFKKFNIVEISVVKNPQINTLRGLHFQNKPFTESKIIQCIEGKVYDIIFDLRVESETYFKHLAIEIGPECKFQGVYIPAGCAHGYLTRTSNTSLIYLMDNSYSAIHASGIRWNDPKLQIEWPSQPEVISKKDENWPLILD
jgi:dTDP-4-dehydrorhamnose 3,5-epimerase